MSSESCLLNKSLHYSEDELELVQDQAIPHHVAIIMDGNRRWAKKQFVAKVTNPLGGHWKGAGILQTIVEAASDLGIKVLTVYAFSTENWSRPPQEVKTLLQIFSTYLRNNRKKMVDRGVCFQTIGDLSPFPKELKEEVAITIEETKDGKEFELVVAMNYGGRDEICRAFQSIAVDIEMGRLSREEISEHLIGRYLDTAPYGDPQLLIRTSGERRISNFLLWQLAYTEVYITDVLWPDFSPKELLTAVIDYQKRKRRLGR